MMQKLETKLKSFDACIDGIALAMRCSTPQEAWEKAKPQYLIWIFFKIADEQSIHRFGLWAARQVQHLMTDPRSLAALDTKEKWLNGEATDDELEIAYYAARAAARAAARDAARAADYAADYAAASAARAADAAAAYAAAYAADAAAYAAAAYADAADADADAADAADADNAADAAVAAADAAQAAQAAWIRENFTPDFEKLLG